MAGSSYGILYKLTTFGESHGTAIGGIIEGFPAGIDIDIEEIQQELNRRRPGQSAIVTQRKEADELVFLSGIFEGRSLGTPIGFTIANTDSRSKDYDHLKEAYRPSHADFTYEQKYGIRDYRGGGRSSARETACRIVAGALAKQILKSKNILVRAFVDQVGPIKLDERQIQQVDFSRIESNDVRCPEPEIAAKMRDLILETKKNGDTIGGAITCFIHGVPPGLGEPVFDKLHAELGKAMLSINAAKGFEIGSGFSGIEMNGSKHNDLFRADGTTNTNHSGGIQGGISNGMPIYFRTAFKPVATILRDQQSINSDFETATISGKGRHDPCVVPRAVPIVEAMAAMVILDFYLRNLTVKI